MDTVVYEEIPDGWNNFVANVTSPSIIYRKEYLDFLCKTGHSLKIISWLDDGKITSALPILVYKKFGLEILFYRPLTGYDSIIHLAEYNNIKSLLAEFISLTKKMTVVFSKLSDLTFKLKKYNTYLLSNGFVYHNEPIYMLDIKPAEEMWNSFNKKVRNSIRKAENFLKIEEVTHPEQVEKIYPMFVETSKGHGDKPHPLSRYLELLNVSNKLIKWLVAKLDGKYIATSIYWLDGDKIIYADNAALFEYRKYAGSDLIMWEVIKFADNGGYKLIDMSGIPKDGVGLQKFKEKWGSRLVNCDVYVYKSPLYRIFSKMEVLRKFLRVV